jgi:hypothetical protein
MKVNIYCYIKTWLSLTNNAERSQMQKNSYCRTACVKTGKTNGWLTLGKRVGI